jgi:hypothetical protein
MPIEKPFRSYLRRPHYDRAHIQGEDSQAIKEGTMVRRLELTLSFVVVVALSLGSPYASAKPADVAVSPPALHFGSREVGDGALQRLLFRNTSEQHVVVYAVSVGAGFSIESLTCFDGPLAAGGRCEVVVGFSPTQVGKWPSTLRIQYCFPTDPLCPGAIFGQERFVDVALIGAAR